MTQDPSKPEAKRAVEKLQEAVGNIAKTAHAAEEMLRKLTNAAHSPFVLVTVSMIEEMLEEAILSKMRPLSENFRDRLFEGYGPLSSFSARIDISYSLGIIDDHLLHDLRLIKSIRNEFAHSTFAMHFDHPNLQKHFQNLTKYQKNKNNFSIFGETMTACFSTLGGGNTRVPEWSEIIAGLKPVDGSSEL